MPSPALGKIFEKSRKMSFLDCTFFHSMGVCDVYGGHIRLCLGRESITMLKLRHTARFYGFSKAFIYIYWLPNTPLRHLGNFSKITKMWFLDLVFVPFYGCLWCLGGHIRSFLGRESIAMLDIRYDFIVFERPFYSRSRQLPLYGTWENFQNQENVIFGLCFCFSFYGCLWYTV